ncbi:MAG: hypothetical protein ACHQFX_07880 [Chitinophagales bacterium]
MKKLLIILSAGIVLSSCYYDKEEDLLPTAGACDITGVTYANAVQPLLQSNGCISCHSGSAPSGNISLNGYNNVKVVALNGKLYGAISHSAGYSPMPQGSNKMNTCNINLIKAWIDGGAVNN